MVQKSTIETLFPKTRRKLLSLLFLHPDEQFYFREILRRTGIRQGVVQRELTTMVKAGILHFDRRGYQTYYYVNKSHPIYAELKGIVLKTFGIADVLRSAILPLRKDITFAVIYGSIATGEETSRSDIDLLLIGDVGFGEITKALSKIEKELGREINPTVYPVKEFKNRLKKKDHFVTSLLDSQLIFLLGTRNELTKLADQ
jgi:predicted nucleotidyltransferase